MSRDVKMDAHLGVSTGSYAGRIEVLGGPTGRRQRSDAEKARIAAESSRPTPSSPISRADMALHAGRYTIGVVAFGVAAWRRRKRLPYCRRSCR